MRPLLVTAIAGSVLALSACGGGAEPPEAAPPSSSGTPSGSASPSASGTPEAEVTLPVEVQGTSADAAVATVSLFIDEVNRASSDGDTAVLRMLFDSRECENCASVTELIEGVYRDGGSIDGGTWRDIELGRPVRGADGQMGVPVKVTGADQRVIKAAGQAEESFPGGLKSLHDYTLVQSNGRWQIVTLNFQELS